MSNMLSSDTKIMLLDTLHLGQVLELEIGYINPIQKALFFANPNMGIAVCKSFKEWDFNIPFSNFSGSISTLYSRLNALEQSNIYVTSDVLTKNDFTIDITSQFKITSGRTKIVHNMRKPDVRTIEELKEIPVYEEVIPVTLDSEGVEYISNIKRVMDTDHFFIVKDDTSIILKCVPKDSGEMTYLLSDKVDTFDEYPDFNYRFNTKYILVLLKLIMKSTKDNVEFKIGFKNSKNGFLVFDFEGYQITLTINGA